MEDLKRALVRANLGQTALLTVPWIVLQVGGFWAFSDPRAGAAGAMGIGIIAGLALLMLGIYYQLSQVQFANIICKQTDADVEFYGFFSLLRFWNDQLESVRKRVPGYLNTLRLNYISLPLAFLACILDFWTVALFMVLVWCLTGMLVRSAVAHSVSGEHSLISGAVKFKAFLLFAAAAASWGYVWFEAGRAEQAFREKIAQLQSGSLPFAASDLEALYKLDGANGAEAVKALSHLPAVPEPMVRLASSGWVENVPADAYVELEKFVFNNAGVMEKITEIGRNPVARLGFDFKQGFAGMSGAELLPRYRKLEELERLRFYSAASVGNDRLVGESWRVLGALRRHLSSEPALSVSAVMMEMESRRLGALERLLNEFGVHSEKEEKALAADLAVTEKELEANIVLALKGETALYLISEIDPLAEWDRTAGIFPGMNRIFPAFRWVRYFCFQTYLDGMEKLEAAAVDPGQLPGVRAWSRTLPFGAAPAISALRVADDAVVQYLVLQRKLRSARIALLLDRYRRARGGFPDSLAELKTLPASVMVDPLTGKALTYGKEGFTVEVSGIAGKAVRRVKFDGAEIGGPSGFRLKR
ncbi:MAG: hypothetical protein HPZ91_07525 [Lentisphaeria bacterium]|nr:hypothetical protein [Lentisphaeria bacterium]